MILNPDPTQNLPPCALKEHDAPTQSSQTLTLLLFSQLHTPELLPELLLVLHIFRERDALPPDTLPAHGEWQPGGLRRGQGLGGNHKP